MLDEKGTIIKWVGSCTDVHAVSISWFIKLEEISETWTIADAFTLLIPNPPYSKLWH